MTINERILQSGATDDDVREWANCSQAEIDEDGDIWVADPMTGNWLSNQYKLDFLAWLEKQNR
jgi:hypothetical protein